MILQVGLLLLLRCKRLNAAMSAMASFSPVITPEALPCSLIDYSVQVHDAAAAVHLIIILHIKCATKNNVLFMN